MIRCHVNVKQNISRGVPMPEKYIWDENSAVKLQTAMCLDMVQNKIKDFNDKTYDSSMINQAVEDVNNILITAADNSLRKRRTVIKNNNKKKKHKPWIDKEINVLKKELNYKFSLMQKYSSDPIV